MILIADSGSTKTDWCAIESDKSILITTKGINPFFQNLEEIKQEIKDSLLPHLPTVEIDAIYFYGAGCIPEKAPLVKEALQSLLQVKNTIQIHTDMLGAARGLCGRQSGIACILGTGSNSCYYNGEEITANVSPLGFILGDEGSGGHLGKLFIGDLLKNQLSPELKEKFLTQYQLTPADIIDRVYRKPFPNRFLASFTPFLLENAQEPSIHALILNSFQDFIRRNVKQYDYTHHPVHFIGSIAFYFQEILKEAIQKEGIQLGNILQSPLKGLMNYHKEMQ